MPLTARPNMPMDLAPLERLLTDEGELALVNPNAKYPFDPLEWQEKWLGELDDASYYVVREDGTEVGFFALRVGIGPEVRHLSYVFVHEDERGGAGAAMTEMIVQAARDLRALTITLKCDLDNEPALNAYRSAGFEELSRSGDTATMRLDLD